MKSGLSLLRALLVGGVALIGLLRNFTIPEYGFFMGAAFLIGGATTAVYLFLYFDRKVNEKVVMQGLLDAFAGLALMSHPEISPGFIMTDLGFWLAFMGALMLSAGFFNHLKSKFFWIYILAGLAWVTFGFTLVNYSPDTIESATFFLSFAYILYGVIDIILIVTRKNNPMQLTDA